MKILLLRLSSMGDVVLATATADYLRTMAPGSQVVFLTKRAFAPLLQGHPAIDEVWAFDSRGEHSGLGGSLAMAARIRAAGFDAIIDLHGNIRSRLLCALSGTRVLRMKNYMLNRRLRVAFPGMSLSLPPDVPMRGVAAAAELLGKPAIKTTPSLKVQADAASRIDAFLSARGVTDGDTLIAVSPGAAWATKRWPTGSFAQALGLLSEGRRKFVFVGNGRDAELAAEIKRYMRKGAERVVIAAGETGLPELAALLSRCRLILTNDSGPMHVAAAVGTPVIAFFGPTVEAFGFFPQGLKSRVLQAELDCRPCSLHGDDVCPIGTHACMQKIAPFDVSKAAEELLAS